MSKESPPYIAEKLFTIELNYRLCRNRYFGSQVRSDIRFLLDTRTMTLEEHNEIFEMRGEFYTAGAICQIHDKLLVAYFRSLINFCKEVSDDIVEVKLIAENMVYGNGFQVEFEPIAWKEKS